MRVEECVTVRARPSAIWAVVGKPENYAGLMDGVSRWARVDRSRGEPGAGSRWSMRMHVGSVDIGGLVEIVEYEPCKDIAWTNVLGIEQRGRWRIREIEPGVSTVALRLTYQSPGGLWGLVADRIARPQVSSMIRTTLTSLRDRCEEDAPDRPGGPGAATLLTQQLHTLRVLAGAGLLAPQRPDRLLAAALELRRWGLTLPGAYAAAAVRYPKDPAIVDDGGPGTYAEVDRRSSAIAAALATSGVSEGDRVAVMCRNHRGFIEASLALGKLGADILYLNTGFAGPQLREVVRREDAAAIILDEEFSNLVGGALPRERTYLAWAGENPGGLSTLEGLAEKGAGAEPPTPEHTSRITILTSGTTGTPKGASRSQPRSADPAVAILSRIPLQARGTTLIAAPLFHAWGFAHFGLGALLSSTLVLQRSFDPEKVLAAVDEHRVTALAAVPVMLQRIADLPPEVRGRYDTSSLRVVAVSGSALSAELAQRFMDAFGDVVYNLYGSTEVAYATIATPQELRSAPGTAGRPPFGTIVKLLDDNGRDVPRGGTGRIFVGNGMLFEGYTGGGSKEVADGLMSTGDVGRFDENGLLFIEGRGDEMIVSGGENVFPAEVEALLGSHADVADVAVVGVPDEEWGQRLRAYIVKRPRSSLSVDDVKAHVRSQLARYKVPRDVKFVDSLPRNAAGKVLKRELVGDGDGAASTRTQRRTTAGAKPAPSAQRPRRGPRSAPDGAATRSPRRRGAA